MMCYTVEGNEDGLIIIDGGYEDDEVVLGHLQNVIKNHNNKIDAWIITHYDTDHAGAYMTLRDRIKDLEVKKVYLQDAPDLQTCIDNASWYDGFYLYERYLNTDIKNKEYLHTGDVTKNIIGLKVEVLSAYEDWIDEKMDNLLNNGSIVFKLYGNDESMLFCADVQEEIMCNYLMENYKDKLPSKYLQVPHHGNNWFTDEFYNTVNPEIAFFPATESIMYNTSKIDWFTSTRLWEFFKNRGTEVVYYNTPVSSVVMK